MYVYWNADACISQEHKERFDDIISLFQGQLLTVRDLARSNPAGTLYKLKMCGANSQEAYPSILICHPAMDVKTGRKIWNSLTTSPLREQYAVGISSSQPAFGIHLFFEWKFWLLGNSMESLRIHMDNSLFVGAKLVSDNPTQQVSTITCGVLFPRDNKIFGLTSAHAFENDGSGKSDELSLVNHSSTSSSGSFDYSDSRNDGFLGMDDEYDWDELEATAGRERVETGFDDSPGALSCSRDRECAGQCEIETSRVWGRPDHQRWARYPNLDWALVEMPMLGQGGLLGWPSDKGTYKPPSGLSDAAGSVVVATSHGRLNGTLSSIPSYLATSRNSEVLTEIWTITLDENGRYPSASAHYRFH